jgi:hypothetical protein
MKQPRKKGRLFLAVAFLALAALAPIAYAVCYGGVTIYWDDGTSTACKSFCTFSGGWLCDI